MKIKIMSKQDIEKFCEEPLKEKTAIICIANYNDKFADLKNSPEKILHIYFDDVDNDVIKKDWGSHHSDRVAKIIERKYHIINEDGALHMAEFYFSVSEEVDLLICQSDNGQSRSAAVAAAFIEYKDKCGIKIFADDRYHPNKVVFRKVLWALNNFEKINNLSSRDFVERMWGKQVIEVIDNAVIIPITEKEFISRCLGYEGGIIPGILDNLKELYPQVYDAIPNQMGSYALRCLWGVLELLEIK